MYIYIYTLATVPVLSCLQPLLIFTYSVCYRVIESKNENFKVGDYVAGMFGWRTKTISNGDQVRKLDHSIYTDDKLSTALGILGMPG